MSSALAVVVVKQAAVASDKMAVRVHKLRKVLCRVLLIGCPGDNGNQVAAGRSR